MERQWKHRGVVGRGRGLLVAGAMLTACVGLPGYPPEGEATGMSSGPGTTSLEGDTLLVTSTLDPSMTSVGSDATTAESSATTGEGPGPFVFEQAPLDRYTQVDRIGFPVVNTLLNLLGDKDAYNQASPQVDAALTFAPDIFTSLETLHRGAPGDQTPDNTGLDDDLAAFGLEPCIPPPGPADDCDDQGGPFVIPDVLTLDLDDPVGFPNGRRFVDPAIDIILAVILLDLETHSVTTFVDLDQDGTPGPSLNPTENDVAFPAEFPYLAPAHE